MGDFKKVGGGQGFKKSFGRPSFQGRQGAKFGGGERREGGRDGSSKPPQMYSAVCSSCGKNCEVPFRPSGDRPVLCSDCFKKREDFPQRGEKRETAVYRAKGAEINHGHSPAAQDARIDDLVRQVATMNAKLDTIMKLLPASPTLGETVGSAMRHQDEIKPVKKYTPKKK